MMNDLFANDPALKVPVMDFPEAGKTRWQPLRAGLVDLFYYDYQEFWFRDGRLLLRGNNGTGKSKVLALTLPFLFDGRTSPSRVEPDGDPQKRMEWNLLMGKRYSERTGYVWLEFGRLRQNGSTEIFTIGCGMKAVKGRPLVTWFFATERRMARDFSLLDSNKRTLSKERLKDVLGEHAVIDQASRYRRIVDDKLFQLGEERYEALITLLIQLRQPQLSKRPDEKSLSKALTEALPPLDQGILNDVAEAFRNLETERQALEGLRETGRAVDEFRRHYRQYSRVAGRRRAAEVRHSQSRYEKISASLNRTRTTHREAKAEQEGIEGEIKAAKFLLQEARIREKTLLQSPEMRDAHVLRQSEERAGEKQANAALAASEVQQMTTRVNSGQEQVEGHKIEMEHSRLETTQRAKQMAELAVHLGMDRSHQDFVLPLQLSILQVPEGVGVREEGKSPDTLISAAESGIKKLYETRAEQIRHITGLNKAFDESKAQYQSILARWQETRDQLEQLSEDQMEAERASDAAGQTLVQAFLLYCRGLQELALSDFDSLAEVLRTWCISLEGPNPATLALRLAFEIASHLIADKKAQTLHQHGRQEASLKALYEEQEKLETGEEQVPPVPYTRSAGARDFSGSLSHSRPGAPLWKLIDFRDEVPDELRASVEAALEASTLLDAWVLPEGSLRDPQTWDVIFQPGLPVVQSLGQILKPGVHRLDLRANTITEAVLEHLLSGIGWGKSDDPAWIDGSGAWRLGPLEGSWGKSEAEYIGHAAREAARNRRLEMLATEITQSKAILETLKHTLDRLGQRKTLLNTERHAAPRDQGLRRSHQELATVIKQKQIQESRLAKEAERLSVAQAALRRQDEARALDAGDLDLPTAATDLADLEVKLNDYRAESNGFWPTLRHHMGRLNTGYKLQETFAQDRLSLQEKTKRLLETQQSAREALAQRDTLRETLGDAIVVVEQKLAQAGQKIQALEIRDESLQKTLIGLIKQISAAAAELIAHIKTQDELRQTRREAIERLAQFSNLGLFTAALPEEEPSSREGGWSIDYALQLARTIEKELHQVDESDKAWQNHQRRVHERINELHAALSRHGHESVAEQYDDLIVVRVVFQAKRCDTEMLSKRIIRTIREHGELLDAKEQALLEEHLINELAGHLQTLIQDAELCVTAMNDEMERRPTSTGMKLRLRWKPLGDGETWLEHTAPEGLGTARKQLLRQSADLWSPEDRKAVGTFLKKQIDEARRAEEASALQEVMARALDYRYWHRFVVERWQEGEWRPAYGPASGGERVLVVTIPLFAAASSYYSSANPDAPRLVLLDEAFAGVDDDSRAKSLGLLAQFDMDVVMTSEREWSCYSEVPGIAIAQLTRREGVDAVHVAHWWWDGRERSRSGEAIPDLEVLEKLEAFKKTEEGQ